MENNLSEEDVEKIEKRIKELENEIKYEVRKLKYCAYGTRDLLYIDGLNDELDKLNQQLYE